MWIYVDFCAGGWESRSWKSSTKLWNHEKALLRAALDFYENEPKVHPGLLKSLNVTLLPHNAVFVDTVSAKT
ncbi:hypothetical protein BDY24DRAFT_413868 [Mrakia frigida]|uniref:uncharacterized protein n=1 Tax=Mrakia frigida TaxID=29902 RepID=UPI003FCBF10E